MSLKCGQLRHRVDLRQKTENRDSSGQANAEYSTYATVWAKITPVSGRETEHADQISAETSHKVLIRYNSKVGKDQRVIFGTRILEIESVINPNERNEKLLLFCKEVG